AWLAALGTLLIASAARGDEPSAATPPIPSSPSKEAPADPEVAAEADVAAARAEATAKLKSLEGTEGEAKPARARVKELREVLEERLRWLDEWEQAARARKDAEHPKLSPAREAG